MHIPSLLFEPLNSFIRLQKPQLGMVVYIRIYVAQWACSTMYMGTTAVHGLSVLCNLKVHGNYSVLFWMCLSNSETIQPAEALQFSMYRLCVAYLWKTVCVCQCVTTHKLSLICFVCWCVRLSFLCIVYCSIECQCDANSNWCLIHLSLLQLIPDFWEGWPIYYDFPSYIS